ncbi:MaoC family dehydratase [Amycolatopsis mongoliensis]|uniref:MaoC family dehydratase n=1 Tax=Amycolatopsis mongoliensis TaxID=715475 RepID=A0A9Y2JJQ0_9PSEU|nr:MaoC family dehydratase [Amycolatopsis sp. 4-36]WIX98641.1 MaoC family dehydratase [Amycolatopsis sp. 4-36]
MREFENLDAFAAAVGEHLGYSEWHTITQDRVNKFADATDDHQWIHVDEAMAAAGPFGGTIAHGFLTLSLLSAFGPKIYKVKGIKMGINYGLNKVRFPQPVRVGSKVRAGAELVEITDIPGGKQAVSKWTVEIDGEAKPACVAEWVTRFLA